MTRIVIDFETYYDKDYSIKKMTMEQYIRDPRFECIGLSIKVVDQPTQFFRAETWIPELKQLLVAHRDHTIVSHNAMFDMGILGIRYGIHPRSLGDTVAMSAVVGLDRCAGRSSLDGLSAYLRTIGYNIPTKGDYVQNMEGVRIADMSPTDWAQYSEYCKTDSDICAAMYDIMLPYMPPGELQMISATIKMFTNPSVKLDTELLEDYQQRLIQKREDLLAGVARKVGLAGADELAPHLRSTVKFAKLLESIGVTVPTKYSEKQDKMIPAVAKTDHEFLELVASENELISTLCEARLGAASNLEMTRCKRFIDISYRGLMPVPLRYAAAHTGRYGGCFVAETEVWLKPKSPYDREPYLTNIVNANAGTLIWNGDEFVEHEGVICTGLKPVYNYQGLCGTRNHKVFIDNGLVTLGEAIDQNLHIVDSKRPALDGTPTRNMLPTMQYVDGACVLVYDILNAGSEHKYWANGKLVHNSDKINLQNLPKRKGDKSLRRSMTAPDDHVLIASDSSQIECRVLAYAAQELPLLNIFLNKDDPYSDMASNIYGLPYDVIYREAKIERTKEGIVRRNVGKTTELGCIAEGTEVLTDRGWVQIQNIQSNDLLWDGNVFVPHGGLLDRGFKPCAIFNNIALTTDHKIYNHISGRWFTVEDILYYTDLSLLANNIADTCNQYSFNDIPSKYRSHLVEARDNKLGINDFITRPILKTYDILNVGTKNCFYVRSINRGSGSSVLKVHNCGYGMGDAKFEGQLKLDGLTEAASNAKAIVQAYRRARPSIVRFWKTCSDVLDIMLAGGKVSFGGPNNDLFLADGSSVFWGKRIPSLCLPNGTYIWYQNLRKVPRQEPAQFGDGMEFVYDQFKSNRFEVNRIYGGKLTENLIQALAFAVLKYQALQIVDMGVPVHMNVHDEWVSIVPKSMAHHAVAVHAKAMRTVPNYIPDGLLDMELDMGKNYADTTTIGGL